MQTVSSMCPRQPYHLLGEWKKAPKQGIQWAGWTSALPDESRHEYTPAHHYHCGNMVKTNHFPNVYQWSIMEAVGHTFGLSLMFLLRAHAFIHSTVLSWNIKACSTLCIFYFYTKHCPTLNSTKYSIVSYMWWSSNANLQAFKLPFNSIKYIYIMQSS